MDKEQLIVKIGDMVFMLDDLITITNMLKPTKFVYKIVEITECDDDKTYQIKYHGKN